MSSSTLSEQEQPKTHPPDITDYEWHDYVMSHFQPSELLNGHPSTDALRRVGELLLGELNISCTYIQIPNSDNENRAVVSCKISYGDTGGVLEENVRFVQDLADADRSNTPKQFHNYLLATASTRAEGRCLRKALRLRKVLAAEELSETVEENDNAYGTVKIDDKVQPQQLAAIKAIIHRININTDVFLTHYKDTKKIEDLSFIDAQDAIQQLNFYQQNPDKIPTVLTEV